MNNNGHPPQVDLKKDKTLIITHAGDKINVAGCIDDPLMSLYLLEIAKDNLKVYWKRKATESALIKPVTIT